MSCKILSLSLTNFQRMGLLSTNVVKEMFKKNLRKTLFLEKGLRAYL